MEYLVKGSEVYVEGRLRSTQWVDKDLCEQRGVEIRVDDLKMLRRAPSAETVPSVARGLESVETLLRQMAAGQREDVSASDLAWSTPCVRTW
jgi:single-stranded DNA-binding protein